MKLLYSLIIVSFLLISNSNCQTITTGFTDSYNNAAATALYFKISNNSPFVTAVENGMLKMTYTYDAANAKWKGLFYNAPNAWSTPAGYFNVSPKTLTIKLKSDVAFPVQIKFLNGGLTPVQTLAGDGNFETLTFDLTGTEPATISDAKQVYIYINTENKVTQSGTVYIDEVVLGDGSLIVDNALGVNLAKELSLSVSPNPASDLVRVSLDANCESYSVYDVTGKEILKKEDSLGNSFSIDLSGVSKGLYLLLLKSDKGTISSKLKVQ